MNRNNTQQNATLVKKLVLTTVAMFGFGFALVPLYDVFCDITGLNGKTNTEAAQASTLVDTSRLITVEFIAHTQANMPWEFAPEVKRLQVHPGENYQLNYLVKNLSTSDKVVQAIPSVSPGLAAAYFNKVECFCFNRQPLEQGQVADLGLMFYIDKDLPEEYTTVTLSYTLFDISDRIEQDEFEQLFAADSTSAP